MSRQAVELLRQALGHGFKDLDKVKADPVFSPVHSRSDFQALAMP
jgi:hypothetical protein